jgi:hypothetical protein
MVLFRNPRHNSVHHLSRATLHEGETVSRTRWPKPLLRWGQRQPSGSDIRDRRPKPKRREAGAELGAKRPLYMPGREIWQTGRKDSLRSRQRALTFVDNHQRRSHWIQQVSAAGHLKRFVELSTLLATLKYLTIHTRIPFVRSALIGNPRHVRAGRVRDRRDSGLMNSHAGGPMARMKPPAGVMQAGSQNVATSIP